MVRVLDGRDAVVRDPLPWTERTVTVSADDLARAADLRVLGALLAAQYAARMGGYRETAEAMTPAIDLCRALSDR